MKNDGVIKNETEYLKTKEYVIDIAQKKLGITPNEARERVNALLQSNMLDEIKYDPTNVLHQKALELFLRIPMNLILKDKTLPPKQAFITAKDSVIAVMKENGEPII